MSEYLIPEGDCLSLIAERHGVTVKQLISLNPQIKDPNLIYTGDTLKISEPADHRDLELIPLPELPELLGTTCGKEYVDVVYFPGKGEWWAISKALQEKYKIEAKIMADAVANLHETKNEEKTTKKLDKLGVLQGFKYLDYDSFLNEEEAGSYRYYKAEVYYYERQIKSKSEDNFSTEHKNFLAEIRGEKPSDEALSKVKNNNAEIISYYPHYSDSVLIEMEISRIKSEYQKERESKVNKLNKKINIFKKEAIKKIKIHNNKVESVRNSSAFKIDVVEHVDDFLITARAKNIEDLSAAYINKTSKNTTAIKEYMNSKVTDKEHYHWVKYLDSFNGGEKYPNAFGRDFFDLVRDLNSYGIVVKEQLLTRKELIGADEFISGFKGSLDKDDLEIDIYDALINAAEEKGQVVGECLSYYQALRLKQRCEIHIQEKVGQLISLLADGPQPGMFFRLGVLLMAAEHRLTVLYQEAQSRIKIGPDGTLVKDIFYLLPEYKLHTVWRLLWNNADEFKAHPIPLQDYEEKIIFFHSLLSGYKPTDAQVHRTVVSPIECYLNSEDGKAYFIRESDICNEKAIASCEAVRLISSSDVSFKRQENGKLFKTNAHGVSQLKEHMAVLLKNISKDNVKNTNFKFVNFSANKKWIDSGLERLPIDLYQRFGVHGQKYNVDLDAQYMRFAMSSKLDAGLNVTKGRIKAKVGGELLKVNFDLASAQLSSEFSIPNKNGFQMSWDYFLKTTSGKVARKIDYGRFRVDINLVFSGYVGVNCMLAAAVELNTHEGSLSLSNIGSGVIGDLPDYDPSRRAQSVSAKNHSLLSNNASGVHGKMGLFAGAQIGMQINADVLWQDPNLKELVRRVKNSAYNISPQNNSKQPNKKGIKTCSNTAQNNQLQKLIDASMPISSEGWLRLCGSEAAASITIGAGLQTQFLLSMKNGRFVFICSAQATWGVGGHVRLGFYVDMGNVDIMIYSMCRALAQVDYRKVSFFDETENVKAYEEIVDTILMCIMTGIRLVILLKLKIRSFFKKILKLFFDERDKHAVNVACYILNLEPQTFMPLSGCDEDQREIWFDNMMPEVRGRLIYLLIVKQKASSDGPTAHQTKEALQREAILKVLSWHSTEGEAKYRQYSETMERINEYGDNGRTDIVNFRFKGSSEEKVRVKQGFEKIESFFISNKNIRRVEVPEYGVLDLNVQVKKLHKYNKEFSK